MIYPSVQQALNFVHQTQVQAQKEATMQNKQNIRDLIEKAIVAQQPVWIDYTDKDGEKTTGRKIEPNVVRTIAAGTSVFAKCHLRNQQRSFALDRISSATLTEQKPKWTIHVGDVVSVRYTPTQAWDMIVASFNGKVVPIIISGSHSIGRNWGDGISYSYSYSYSSRTQLTENEIDKLFNPGGIRTTITAVRAGANRY